MPRWNPVRYSSHDRGFTLVELLVVVAVVGVVAAIATPGLLRSRMSANESSAIGSLRAIVSAQLNFASLSGGFADDLATLAAICPGSTSAFVLEDLSFNNVEKSGFSFAVVAGFGAVVGPGDCLGTPTRTTYYASAKPLMVGSTGSRGFATNVAGTLWEDTSGGVPPEPFIAAGTISPLGR